MISVVPILAVLTTAAELRQAVWSGVHEGERFSIECTVTAAMDKDNPDHSAYAIMDARVSAPNDSGVYGHLR